MVLWLIRYEMNTRNILRYFIGREQTIYDSITYLLKKLTKDNLSVTEDIYLSIYLSISLQKLC